MLRPLEDVLGGTRLNDLALGHYTDAIGEFADDAEIMGYEEHGHAMLGLQATKKLEDEIKRAGGPENITEENMPEAHIRGDINTPYKCVGGAVYTMQRAGFARVGFISEPAPGGAVTRL